MGSDHQSTHIGGAITVITAEFVMRIANARKAKPSSTKTRRKRVSRIAIRAPNSSPATAVRTHSTTYERQRPFMQPTTPIISTSKVVYLIFDAGWSKSNGAESLSDMFGRWKKQMRSISSTMTLEPDRAGPP